MKVTKNKKRIDPRYFLNEQGREEEELISEMAPEWEQKTGALALARAILDQIAHGGKADPSALEKAWNSYMEYLDADPVGKEMKKIGQAVVQSEPGRGGGQRGAYKATRRRGDSWDDAVRKGRLSKIGPNLQDSRELGDDEPEFVVHPAKDPPRDPRGDAGFMNFLRDVAMGRDWRKGLPRSREPIDAPLLEPKADPRYPLKETSSTWESPVWLPVWAQGREYDEARESYQFEVWQDPDDPCEAIMVKCSETSCNIIPDGRRKANDYASRRPGGPGEYWHKAYIMVKTITRPASTMPPDRTDERLMRRCRRRGSLR